MKKIHPLLCISFCIFILPLLAVGQEKQESPTPAAEKSAEEKQKEALESAQAIIKQLQFKQGEITLANGLAKVSLPEDFSYLDGNDTVTVLTKLWGNPPSEGKPLGMLLSKDADLLSDDSWVVVMEYEEDGHVSDEDANKIDYKDLLKSMQKGSLEVNKKRVEQGYPPITLVGWAASPHYDQASHKLHWAKELKFGDSPTNELNYNIRVLGRQGVLVLNVIARMGQLQTIQAEMPKILSMVDFAPGQTYADYNPSTDKLATYGLAALVAGGVAAKMGLLKFLWVGILAFKKLIIVGVIAIGAFIAKLFRQQA